MGLGNFVGRTPLKRQPTFNKHKSRTLTLFEEKDGQKVDWSAVLAVENNRNIAMLPPSCVSQAELVELEKKSETERQLRLQRRILQLRSVGPQAEPRNEQVVQMQRIAQGSQGASVIPVAGMSALK